MFTYHILPINVIELYHISIILIINAMSFILFRHMTATKLLEKLKPAGFHLVSSFTDLPNFLAANINRNHCSDTEQYSVSYASVNEFVEILDLRLCKVVLPVVLNVNLCEFWTVFAMLKEQQHADSTNSTTAVALSPCGN